MSRVINDESSEYNYKVIEIVCLEDKQLRKYSVPYVTVYCKLMENDDKVWSTNVRNNVRTCLLSYVYTNE